MRVNQACEIFVPLPKLDARDGINRAIIGEVVGSDVGESFIFGADNEGRIAVGVGSLGVICEVANRTAELDLFVGEGLPAGVANNCRY